MEDLKQTSKMHVLLTNMKNKQENTRNDKNTLYCSLRKLSDKLFLSSEKFGS